METATLEQAAKRFIVNVRDETFDQIDQALRGARGGSFHNALTEHLSRCSLSEEQIAFVRRFSRYVVDEVVSKVLAHVEEEIVTDRLRVELRSEEGAVGSIGNEEMLATKYFGWCGRYSVNECD